MGLAKVSQRLTAKPAMSSSSAPKFPPDTVIGASFPMTGSFPAASISSPYFYPFPFFDFCHKDHKEHIAFVDFVFFAAYDLFAEGDLDAARSESMRQFLALMTTRVLVVSSISQIANSRILRPLPGLSER